MPYLLSSLHKHKVTNVGSYCLRSEQRTTQPSSSHDDDDDDDELDAISEVMADRVALVAHGASAGKRTKNWSREVRTT